MRIPLVDPTSRTLLAYWDRQRGHRPAPTRRQIDPTHVRQLLPQLFIIEPAMAGGSRFRLAGTAVCALFGRELRGSRLADLWIDGGAPSIERIVAQVPVLAQPHGLTLCAETRAGRTLHLEMLLLPVAAEAATPARILGCLAPLSRPDWLDVDTVIGVVTHAAGRIDAAAEAASWRDSRSPEARAQARPPRRPSYLRLVKDDGAA